MFGDFKSELAATGDAWKALASTASRALDTIANKALESAASGIWDLIFGAVGGALGGGFGVGKGLTGAATYGFSGRGSFGIPGLATGGEVARGGLTWVGEKGPELLNLPGGSRVFSNAQSMAMADRLGSSVATVHVHYAPTISGVGMTEQQLKATLRADREHLRSEFPAMYADAVRRSCI